MMAFEIDDAETEALLQELVRRTGKPLELALLIAARERIERLKAEASPERSLQKPSFT
jgi:hypothetical protein